MSNFSNVSFIPYTGSTAAASDRSAAGTKDDESSGKVTALAAGTNRHIHERQNHQTKKVTAVDVDCAASEDEDIEKQDQRREANTIISANTTRKLSRLLEDYIDMETKYRQERRKHLATREEMKRLRLLMQQEAASGAVEVQLFTRQPQETTEAFQDAFQKSFQLSSPSPKIKSSKDTTVSMESTTANESETGGSDNSDNINGQIHDAFKKRGQSFDSHDISLFLDNECVDDPESPATTEHLGGSRQYWRDIILGVNDGLVSTFLLVAGVAGGGMTTLDILLTAIAGAIAGAVSMCAGEYVATKSQNEVIQGEVKLEKTHIQKYTRDELLEVPPLLELIGITNMNRDLQKQLLKHYAKDQDALLQLMMVLELGFLEDEQRSPFKAGGVSFFLFLFGAIPSVVPFMVPDIEPTTGLIASAAATSFALLMVGVVKTWASKGNCLTAALENLTVAGVGGAIAYGTGMLAERVLYGGS